MNMLQLPDASLCVRLAATMGHFLWQGAAVYLLVIFASLLLGRASAGARYAVFAAALLVMAVCPPVTFVALRSPETPAMSGAGQGPPHVRSDDTVMRPEMPSAFLGGQSPPYPSEPVVSPSAETVSLNVPPEPAAEAIDWWRYAPYLVGCYLGGTSLMLARLLVALCGGQRLRRRSEPVDDSAILAAFARQARALGLRFTPAIAFCRDVAVPTVVGVLRPMILLPLSAASGLTTEQIEVLLAHELAHIRRYDYLVNILQRLIEAVLFFHPAVWFVSRRIRIEREHCCDDLVLAVGGQRFAYAESLVRMAELSTGGQSPPYMAAAAVALGAADRPSQLRLRILRLVSGSTGEPVRLLRPAVFGLCVFLMLAVVACIRLTSSRTYDRAVDAMPAGMVGTWFFENPMGDDEQMAVFPDGRVVVLYSNGHRDETRYTDGTIELDEYANLKAKLLLLPDGRTLQTSGRAQGIAKLWQRIDAVPKTELLRPLMEAPAAPAATPPPTQPADAPAWGEAVDGLQAAVELVPAKEAYAYGEKIDVRFRLRNVSDRTIPIATATQRQDRAEVRDDGGTIREVPAKWYSGWPRIVRHELKPGQDVTLESTGLGIVQEWQEVESPWRQTGVILKGKPGRYAIRYLLPFPDVRWERPDGTVSVPQPTDWQGALKTGWRELTVKLPNDAAERRTAAAEAVRLPDSLAWAFDPTPGLEIGAHESRLRFRLGTKTLDLDVVDGKARAAWSDGAKQNELVDKVVRIDRPAPGDSGASAREPVLIDVVDGEPLSDDAASPLLDATRPSFVKGKLRFRGWGSASHLIDTHEGKLRIWEPDTRRMIESQGLRYGGSPAAPSTVPAARPDTRPAPGGHVSGRSGDLPYGTARPEAQEAIQRLAWLDSDPRVRETAAETLGGLREPSAVEALIAALKDEDVGVRRAAAGALGEIGDARAVGPLIELYHDRKYESFKDALRALGEIGGDKATTVLIGALQDEDEYARNFAARGLEKSGWRPADRQQRIRYLLALDKWDEAVTAGPAAKPADEAANQTEGRFELDIPIVIALKKGDEGPGGFPRHSVVQFRVVEKRLQAVLDVRFSSWPQTKWLFAIDVLDAAGKVLAQATATHVTSGAIARVPFEEPAEIQFRFSGAADPAKAVGFRIGVESVSTNQGNPIAFDEELPLRLALNAIEYSNAIEAKWIRFDRSKDRFGASVRVSLLSWPKAKYRVRVEIPGPENRVLAHAEQVIESAGVIERVPSVSEETLRFDLGSAEVLEEAAQPLRYVVWLERVDDQAGATTRPPPAGLQGTVFLPDGKPAVGAQVVLLLAEHEARFVDGRFEREVHNRTESKPNGILAVTDADGQFNFPARPACFAVAILHDEGYVELPLTRLTESPITLRPWSRVEGMVLGLDKFRTSRPVDHLVTYRTYGRDGLGERGWQQENANINLRYNINPDSQGRFIIERVPPGECWLKREWVRRQADSEVHLSGGETRFEIGPGQTTRVTVGGMRRVVGRLLAAVDADFQISPKNTRIRYFLEATGFHVDSSGVDPVFNAYQEFLRSDEGKAYSGDVSPAEDGSFEIRDLPPARYFMQVRVVDPSGQEGKKDKVLGWITSGFDLTAGVGDADEAALDVGTVEVQPGEDSPRRDWGEAVEGLQCRLWAGPTHLRIGQSPELATAIRNRGNRELSVARSQELCELQVDGRWYRWADEIDVRSSHFPPGGEFGGISIFLGPQWQAKDDGAAKLDLRPGRHTIRVAFIAQPGGPDVGQPVRVVSNPVEIEIAGAGGEGPGTTRPAGGSRVVLEGLWAKGQVIDGAGRKFGIEGPVYVFDPEDPKLRTSKPASVRSPMLDIREIEFMSRDNYPRVDVAFQFRDGKTAGGALFEMTLFDKNKAVLGTQRVLELRNREMPKQVFASFIAGGDDPPNRSGKAELYFRDVSLADVDSYRLIVSEPDVAGLIRLLAEKDIYPRESAIRALGQISSAALPAVAKLTQFLDDPQPRLRDAARQALARIQDAQSASGEPDRSSATRPVPDDIADMPVLDLTAGGNEKMRYFLIGPRPDERVSAAGYKLLIVLPGGDGRAHFNPFVCRIFKNALPAGYIVAQPVAFRWTPDQQIVWPTRMNKVPGQQFATEDFVEAVIKDVRSKHKVDDRCVFTLSWSSGGPAAYAISLAENSPVTGSFVAMSVFRPDQLPSLDRAKGHAYYIYHSPDDRVCSYRMAQQAENMLKEKVAAVTLKTYPGGHGWKGGDIFGSIRTGIEWLERQHGDQAPSAGGGRKTLFSQPSP
ncbi:MAG: M56 family metallopeptidase [Phycisphaerae bacterium]|nr:M56 family metallopeptidase [Phycisphaerae bacterium]